MRHLCLPGFVLLIFVLSCSVNAEPATPNTVELPLLQAAYVEFPPLTYTDQDGNPAGRYIALSEQVAAKAGYRLHWRELPISRIYLFLQAGRLDFWPGVGGLPHIQPWVVESQHTLMFLTLSAFHLASTPSVDDFNDLEGHRLIVMAGYTYLGAIDHLKNNPDTRFYSAPGHEAGLRMLTMGRGDYLIDYIQPMLEVLKRHPVNDLQTSELMSSRLAFVMSRYTVNVEQVMSRFDDAYEELIRLGYHW